MSNATVLERNYDSMKRADEAEILQILDRLDKLSTRPENPGMAYRNLETIAALVHPLRGKLSKADVLQILDRFEKLSLRPDNPGMAYRNLETIAALTHTLRETLNNPVKVKIG